MRCARCERSLTTPMSQSTSFTASRKRTRDDNDTSYSEDESDEEEIVVTADSRPSQMYAPDSQPAVGSSANADDSDEERNETDASGAVAEHDGDDDKGDSSRNDDDDDSQQAPAFRQLPVGTRLDDLAPCDLPPTKGAPLRIDAPAVIIVCVVR